MLYLYCKYSIIYMLTKDCYAIGGKKMYQKILNYLKEKPILYSASTASLWDDEHISKGMLDAHLNTKLEAASRNFDFIVKSVDWISNTFYSKDKNKMLDLGCGPGLYTELFYKARFDVTGIDFSKRSIEYASKSADSKNLPIQYIYKNYLEIDYENVFDVITLIYCDYGVLSPEHRTTLLKKIKKALKPNGFFILDGFTQHQIADFSESRTIEYHDKGYWSEKPYVCIQSNYLYPESNNYLEQFVIIKENNCECYNNWNQVFTSHSFNKELAEAGFEIVNFYDDVAGKPFTGTCNTLCAVAK